MTVAAQLDCVLLHQASLQRGLEGVFFAGLLGSSCTVPDVVRPSEATVARSKTPLPYVSPTLAALLIPWQLL